MRSFFCRLVISFLSLPISGRLHSSSRSSSHTPLYNKKLQQINDVKKDQYSLIYSRALGTALLSNHGAARRALACHGAVARRLEALRVNSGREGGLGSGVVRGGGRANANSHPATREMSSRSNSRADSSARTATRGATASG